MSIQTRTICRLLRTDSPSSPRPPSILLAVAEGNYHAMGAGMARAINGGQLTFNLSIA